jgi:hypothetical protein
MAEQWARAIFRAEALPCLSNPPRYACSAAVKSTRYFSALTSSCLGRYPTASLLTCQNLCGHLLGTGGAVLECAGLDGALAPRRRVSVPRRVARGTAQPKRERCSRTPQGKRPAPGRRAGTISRPVPAWPSRAGSFRRNDAATICPSNSTRLTTSDRLSLFPRRYFLHTVAIERDPLCKSPARPSDGANRQY